MPRHCIALYSLLLLAFTLQGTQSSSLRTELNVFASQNGEVLISKDTFGLYVEVDLAYHPSSTLTGSKMLLGLASSATLLANYDCLKFNSYDCSQYNCTEIDWSPLTITYPYFQATTKLANTDIYLDYSNWNLNAYAYLTQTCTKQASENFGSQRKGVLGMGTSDNSVLNFINSKIFSIYLNKDLSGGKLLFSIDSSLVTSAAPTIISTGTNWQTLFYHGRLAVGDYSLPINGTLMFDIHADAIGFPLKTFQKLISFLVLSKEMPCTNENYQPTCTLNGYISSLPTITLQIAGTRVDIPPEVYVQNSTDTFRSNITLNLKAISPTLSKQNYVTDFFDDAFIMDAHFMSYYYTIFDQNSGKNQIKLYVVTIDSPESKNNGWIIPVVLGVFALLCTAGAFIFYKRKKLPSSSSNHSANSEPPLLIANDMTPGQGYVQTNACPISHKPIRQQSEYDPPQQYQQSANSTIAAP